MFIKNSGEVVKINKPFEDFLNKEKEDFCKWSCNDSEIRAFAGCDDYCLIDEYIKKIMDSKSITVKEEK